MTSPSPVPGPIAPGATVGDVGEFGLIRLFSGRFEQGPRVFVGPGDDAAVVRAPKGHVVVSTDLLVEGRHFRRDWASATDVGRRAAAQNLSDVNAMGGRATALTVGLTLPADLPAQWVVDLADGIAEEAALVGASVVGGDLTRGSEIVVAVTVLGECEVAPVLRSGAGPGDVLAICGRQGWAAAGLAVLGRGFRSPRAVVEAHKRPQPPYDAGPAAASGGATAMIDVSDGLVADTRHLAEDSGVDIDVWTSAFTVDEPLRAVGAALGLDPLEFVLGGGEDHPLVATFSADVALPEGFRQIGTVATAAGTVGSVTVDGESYEGPEGWSHF